MADSKPAMRHPTADSPQVPETAAEALVLACAAHGADRLFLNPGTDTAPVQEALSVLHDRGAPVPKTVLCPHESVALAAAHGYFAKTGDPQVVMVHVDVGTQNLGAMVHNAARDHAGVVIIAGRTPITSNGELPGGRDNVVHWHQDVPDQAGIVRPYVKSAIDITAASTVPLTMARAFQLATSTPPGPVYLTVAREVLMDTATAHTPVDIARHRPAAPPGPDPAALQTAADLLADSHRPLVVTARLGRNPAAVTDLVALADLLGAPVVDRRQRVNIPSTHPGYIVDPARAHRAITEADVLLVLDNEVPWVPTRMRPSEDATIIHVNTDPVSSSRPGWTFPVDVGIHSDPALFLRQLTTKLDDSADATQRSRWENRRQQQQVPVEANQSGHDNASPSSLSAADIARALSTLLDAGDVVVEEATTNSDAFHQHLRRTESGTLFQSGGSGLGWALGGSIGAKLAAPDRDVVTVIGDGSFLFGCPDAALWTARAAHAPTLTVVLDNGGYAASRRPVLELFPSGSSTAHGDVVATSLSPYVDYTALAHAWGAFGAEVSSREDLMPTLRRARQVVGEGRSAIVGAHLTTQW